MLIVKENYARYELREADQSVIGTITRGSLGWTYRNARGGGPRHPRSTPVAALNLAVAFNFLPSPIGNAWAVLIGRADEIFAHNQKVAKETAR